VFSANELKTWKHSLETPVSLNTHSDWRPPYAYIPGETDRHDESLFDFLTDDIEGTTLQDLPHTSAWLHGMAFIKDGYFWEAHEVFEAIWMACPPNSAEKLFVQSVIQNANSALKNAMGQTAAAQKIKSHAQALEQEARTRSGGVLFGQADFMHYSAYSG